MLEREKGTKMIQKLRNISYEMRLKECGLTTPETRRLRGDQIEVFKVLNRYENIDRNLFSRLRKRDRLEDMVLHQQRSSVDWILENFHQNSKRMEQIIS